MQPPLALPLLVPWDKEVSQQLSEVDKQGTQVGFPPPSPSLLLPPSFPPPPSSPYPMPPPPFHLQEAESDERRNPSIGWGIYSLNLHKSSLMNQPISAGLEHLGSFEPGPHITV